MPHPLQLFEKLTKNNKMTAEEAKEALALLGKNENKSYDEIQEKGLNAIQLTQEEKQAAEAILTDKTYPLSNFNFNVYAELLFLTRLSCKYEENQGAELNAIKLTLMFANTQKAVNYLIQFQKSNKKERKQLIHDACLFNPPTGNVDYPLWQAFAVKFMPNKDFETLLPHAEKIQNYVKEKHADLEKEIWNDLIRKHELKLSVEYDQKNLAELDYINEKMKIIEGKITKEIKKALDQWAKVELKLTDKKIGPEEQKEINKFCSEKGQAEKNRLTNVTREKYHKLFLQEYQKHSPNNIKSEEIKKQLNDLGLSYNSPPDLTAKSKSVGVKKILEDNFKTSSNKIYSEATDLETLLEYAANVSYARSKENPAVAKLFFSLGVGEKSFNKYLTLKPCDDAKQIPDIFIDGDALGYSEYYLKKLSPFDPRAAVLGKLTSCCQSLGCQGEQPAIYGIESPYAGFYILCKNKSSTAHEADPILSQCLVWRSMQGNIVFDSIESQVNFRAKNQPLIIDFFLYLAHRLTTEYQVPFILAGTGGQTPDRLGKRVPQGCCERTNDYSGYSDAKTQMVVAIKHISLVKSLAQQNQSSEKYLQNLEVKNTATINVDKPTIRKIIFMLYKFGRKEIFLNELFSICEQLNLTRESLSHEIDIVFSIMDEYKSLSARNPSLLKPDEVMRVLTILGMGLGIESAEYKNKFFNEQINKLDFEFKKEDFEIMDIGFRTDLLCAAMKNKNMKLVKFLIDNQLVYLENPEIIITAVEYCSTDIVKDLIKKGAKFNNKCFSLAVKRNKLETAKYIHDVQYSIDVNADRNILVNAIFNNNVHMVKYLLELKIDIHKNCGGEKNALLFALSERRTKIAEFLVMQGGAFHWDSECNQHLNLDTGNIKILKLMRDQREKYIPISQKPIMIDDSLSIEEKNKMYDAFQEKGKGFIEQEYKNHEAIMKQILDVKKYSDQDQNPNLRNHKYFQILIGMEKIDLKKIIYLYQHYNSEKFIQEIYNRHYLTENGIRFFEKNYVTFFELLDVSLLDDVYIRFFIDEGGYLVCEKSNNFRLRHFNELGYHDKHDVLTILLSPKGKAALTNGLINIHDFLKIEGKENRAQFIDNLDMTAKSAEKKSKSASLQEVSIFSADKNAASLPQQSEAPLEQKQKSQR